VLGEQSFRSICNEAHVSFAHPLQPHLNLIWVILVVLGASFAVSIAPLSNN
jgi:hypothetical protein